MVDIRIYGRYIREKDSTAGTIGKKKNAMPNKSLAFLLAFPVLFQPLDLMDLGMFPTALHLYSNTLKV